ncbi:MAG TPA: hypothetical protein VLL97_04535 [Acidobacteriota bacterium]|nr:hypothetical protein [Acidobacteriota bacterium]
MQMLVQVVCQRGPSMRDAIARNSKLEDHCLKVTEQRRHGRSRGWTKVRSTEAGRHGAINLEWDADTNILISRVVTRGRGKANLIIGDFVDFLLSRFPARIQAINIIPRR